MCTPCPVARTSSKIEMATQGTCALAFTKVWPQLQHGETHAADYTTHTTLVSNTAVLYPIARVYILNVPICVPMGKGSFRWGRAKRAIPWWQTRPARTPLLVAHASSTVTVRTPGTIVAVTWGRDPCWRAHTPRMRGVTMRAAMAEHGGHLHRRARRIHQASPRLQHGRQVRRITPCTKAVACGKHGRVVPHWPWRIRQVRSWYVH
jgi:hypothetical protein